MTMISTALRVAAAAAAALSLGHTHAHHSYGMFDHCNATSLDGEIIKIEWVNPHVVINLRTRDVDDYRVEWLSLTQLSRPRSNVQAGTLDVGDRLTIVGHAMKDPNLKVLSLVSEIARPSDGWTWLGTERPLPPSCTPG
jgi:hypothetical protein